MSLFAVNEYDKKYYEENLFNFLPDTFIDCHTHVWLKEMHDEENTAAAKFGSRSQLWPRLVSEDNSIEDLRETNQLLFPGKTVINAIYGDPIVTIDRKWNNAYVAENANKYNYPALYLSHPSQSAEELEKEVKADPVFKGIKVYLQFSPSYIPDDEIRIYDFLPKKHLEVCNRNKWVVQLHIARPKRLADPVNYIQLREIEEGFPDLQLSVAHLGRAYADGDVGDAFEYLKNTKKTVWDFTANTNDHVIEQVLTYFGPERLMYGSDFPIFRMKARRTVENGFYINEVPEGEFPKESIAADRHMRAIPYPEAKKITFFIYEEMMACKMACERLGLGRKDIDNIFYGTAARVFKI